MNDLGFDPRTLEAVIFDFDGVILESAAIKELAFLELFADHPQHREAIRAHHREHLGVSRFEKFEWIYAHLIRRPLSESTRRELGERFSALVLDRTLASPFVPGAVELLRELHGRLPLFIASATPQEELEAIVEAKDLSRYFRGIHGSPPSKVDLLRRILATDGLDAATVVLIGDGLSDYRAATSVGCRFILRETDGQAAFFAAIEVARVTDLTELLSIAGDLS